MNTKIRTYFIVGIFLFLGIVLLNISLGSVKIPFSETFSTLIGSEVSNESWKYIILEYRLPKALTAILAGSGLALSGLLMQTLFRNPLAGPYVLGLSSGAGLGVALLLMGGIWFGSFFGDVFFSKWALILAASFGSLLVLFAVLAASMRLRDTMAILIVGLMFASLTGAVVNVLSYFSPAANLQRFVFWSFGSLGNLSWQEVGLLALFWFFGIFIAIFCIKNLNALLLGERYAKSLGVPIKTNRILVIVATSLLAGSITAFAGPIAFVGLAVPHLVRQIIPSNDHRVLVPSVLLAGAILMLCCDIIAQLPGGTYLLPINAITSIFGAPIVIWLLVRKKKLVF